MTIFSHIKNITYLIFVIFSFTTCNQGKRTLLGEDYAKLELQKTLKDTTLSSVVHSTPILIKDKATAIAVVEPILFNVYGKDNIILERPYETYHIDQYWVILGTIPNEAHGGGFLIIIDERNSKVLRLTHFK